MSEEVLVKKKKKFNNENQDAKQNYTKNKRRNKKEEEFSNELAPDQNSETTSQENMSEEVLVRKKKKFNNEDQDAKQNYTKNKRRNKKEEEFLNESAPDQNFETTSQENMSEEVLVRKKKKFNNENQDAEQNYTKNKRRNKKEEEFSNESAPDQNSETTSQEKMGGDQWSQEDTLKLIKRIEVQIPKNDTKSFTNRIEKLDWELIKFKNHSVDDCYNQWKVLRSKVRHYRVLGEVLADAKAWVENPWCPSSKGKKTRHPEMPPRPLSSYMLFYMDKKNKIIRRHPELKLTEISKLIGEKYKTLSEEKKGYYVDKAKIMQDEYKQNLQKFYEKYPEFMKITNKKDPRPNRPLPPMKLYINDKLKKHEKDEHFNRHDSIEKYKELWKKLTFKKKAYWIRIAKDEEDKFLEHMNEDLLNDDKPAATYKSIITKDENAILDRLAGKPEKPPNSAYSLFSRLMLQDKDHNYIDGEPKNRMKEIAVKWKELPDSQKKEYAERVQHMHEEYKLDFANYLEGLPEEKKAEELAKLQPKKKAQTLTKKKTKKTETLSDAQKQRLFQNEPEKPPVTAWDLYKIEFMKRNSHLPKKEAFKQAAAMWKNLPKEQTEKYKRKHEKLKCKYIADFEHFLKTLDEDELKEYSAMKTAKSGDDINDDSLEESSSEQEDNSLESSVATSEDSDSGEEG